MLDHIGGERESVEVVSGNDTVLVNCKEYARAGPVGDLAHSYGGNGTDCHCVGSVLAGNVIHAAEGQVTVALGVCGPVVYELECAQLVRPS